MGELYKVKRRGGEITVQVLQKPEIINGEWIPAGWLKVVKGLNNEEYRIDPEAFLKGYEPSDELMIEIRKANGWK